MSSQPPGFTFPGTFEICAMGPADAGLDRLVPELLTGAGLDVRPETLTVRPSRAGNYVSVTVRFAATDRGQYESAHEVLRAHPDVKWTL
jgi:hypothetical protein